MSTADHVDYQPVPQEADLDALAVFQPNSELGPRFWTELDKRVQQVLSELDDSVRSNVPPLRIQPGSTQGRHFYFCYRTYSRTDIEKLDPVVVGLTFVRQDDNDEISIEADISGEETGDGIATLPRRKVARLRDEIVRTALDLATLLSRHAQQVSAALRDPSRIS
jgi:hypothetical protein